MDDCGDNGHAGFECKRMGRSFAFVGRSEDYDQQSNDEEQRSDKDRDSEEFAFSGDEVDAIVDAAGAGTSGSLRCRHVVLVVCAADI